MSDARCQMPDATAADSMSDGCDVLKLKLKLLNVAPFPVGSACCNNFSFSRDKSDGSRLISVALTA